MTNLPPTPAEEIAERAAESIPALQAAAAAVGLQDHQRMLRDHARRVRDSHRMGAKAAGFDDIAAEAAGDDVGDIIISGDITNTYLPAQQAPGPTMSEPRAGNGLSNLAKVAIVGASLVSGGLGAAIPLVAGALWNKPAAAPAPAPAPLPDCHDYEIRLVPEK